MHGFCAIYDPASDLPFVCQTPYNISDGSIL